MAIMAQLILTSAIILGGFYFILLRPVLQQQRRTKRDLLDLAVGDEIVTTGGLIGVVTDIRQPAEGQIELMLELSPGVTVRALTTAIQERRGSAEAALLSVDHGDSDVLTEATSSSR